MHISCHLLQMSEVRISYRDQSSHDHCRCWLMWGFKPYSPSHHMGNPATLKGECQRRHETKRQHEAEITDLLPLFGLGKLSCRWKTTFSTKCWMLLCSGPRTNTIQSWVKPSTVGFFLTWARWPSSSFTWTAPCKIKWCWLTTQFQDKFLKTNMN